MVKAHAGNWRRMARADPVRVALIGELVRPTYPEDATVFAERLQLYPAGCLVLECGRATQGYAVSHPWLFARPPPLNRQLQKLPARPDTFYIHGVALAPEIRRSHPSSQAGGPGQHVSRRSRQITRLSAEEWIPGHRAGGNWSGSVDLRGRSHVHGSIAAITRIAGNRCLRSYCTGLSASLCGSEAGLDLRRSLEGADAAQKLG